MSSTTTPGQVKLRACLLCSKIYLIVSDLFAQSLGEFKREGCDNCEEILGLRGNSERIFECTTTAFSGSLAIIDPPESWVARWQRVDRFVPGIYAIQVAGRLPEDVVMELESRGITYRPRDGSAV